MKLRTLGHACGVVVLVVLMAACGGGSTSSSIDKGEKLIVAGDYPAAVIELKSALQQSPNDGTARFWLGVALLEQGKSDAAKVEFDKAREVGFDENRLAPKLGRALLSAGKYKEAVSLANEYKPPSKAEQAELFAVAAIGNARLDQRKQADEAIDAALAAAPEDPWALAIKARFVAANGNFDEGLQLINRAIATNRRLGDAYLLKGLFLRYGKGDTKGADEAFAKAAQDPVYEISARSYLIDSQLREDKIALAKQQLEALTKKHPKNLQVIFIDGVVSYADKNYVRAEAIADQLLRYAPDNVHLLVLGGAAALHRGAYASAEAKLGKVVQTVEGADGARRLLAEVYLKSGQADRALGSLKPLLERQKPDAASLSLGAHAQLLLGRARQAQSMFEAAAVQKPDDLQIRTSLALLDLAKGKVEAAYGTLEALAQRDPGEMADLALISAQLKRRDFDLALQAVARLEKKSPGSATAAHLRGVALMLKGDRAGARQGFDAALRANPTYTAAIVSLAGLDEDEGSLEQAKQRYVDAIAKSGRDVTLRMAYLDLLARTKAKADVQQAAIASALREMPAEPGPHLAKIAEARRSGDTKRAVAAAQEALASLPNTAEIVEAAGSALLAGGDEQQAVSAFRRLASLTPRSPRPYLRLAEVHLRRGESQAVNASLSRALEVAPLSDEVHAAILKRASQTKDFGAALGAARQVQKAHERRGDGFELEGDVLALQKKWEPAVAAYRASIERVSSSSVAIKAMRALGHAGGPSAQDAFAKQWVHKYPKDAIFRAFLGDQARQQGKLDTAAVHYRAVLALEPDHGGVLNNLAWVLGQRGDPEALVSAERAVSLRPRQPEFVDTLVEILVKNGRQDRALDLSKRSLAANPDDPHLKLALARSLIATGDKPEARRILSELQKLGAAFPGQAEVVVLLSRQT